jgi:hypothetical protein
MICSLTIWSDNQRSTIIEKKFQIAAVLFKYPKSEQPENKPGNLHCAVKNIALSLFPERGSGFQ